MIFSVLYENSNAPIKCKEESVYIIFTVFFPADFPSVYEKFAARISLIFSNAIVCLSSHKNLPCIPKVTVWDLPYLFLCA